MKKWIYILTTILIAIFVLLFINCYTVSETNPTVEYTKGNCQYPERPLNADGSCNNTDPCDPTTTKVEGLWGDCRDTCIGNESGDCEFNPYIEGKDNLDDPIYTQGKGL